MISKVKPQQDPELIKCKKEFLQIARRAVEVGLQSSTGGNISIRCGHRFLIKGMGHSFYDLKESGISIVDLDGNNLFGTPKPSKEIHFHLGIYRTRNDVCGVVHYHAPFSTAYAVRGISIPLLTVHAKRILKKIPITPEAPDGSKKLADYVMSAFRDRGVKAILLAGHGLVAVGSTLAEAQNIAELVEESAKVSLLARLLGSSMKKTVLLIITLDTKAEEALFLKKALKRQGLNVLIMDVGVFPSLSAKGDITRQEVAAAAGEEIESLIQTKDKEKAIKTMMTGATALTESLYQQGRIHGVLSIGGAQGTIIGTSAMKALPLGVPKLMLSTVASGKRVFEDYVGTTDMILMHSVVDFFGLNGILKQVLSNAAGALAGMVTLEKVRHEEKRKVAITIYGTTTPAGRLIVSLLEKAGYEVVAFHPNGTGGMAMERMIREGNFSGVIDLTTHELADELAGGDHACGPHRLEAASDMKIPQIVVPGSIDYIVKGRFETLAPSLKKRTTMMHNPEMTFVKTSVKEMAQLGRIIAHKLNRSKGNAIVMIPMKGFSHPNDRGSPLYNPKGCHAFAESLKKEIKSNIPIKEFPHHINDEAFGREVIREFQKLMEKK